MDVPTNHLDMEVIEALNLALKTTALAYLIFVRHDLVFVSTLATYLIESKDNS
jgi:ATPase subunit of ABC transporter with duplicated ATPase domains